MKTTKKKLHIHNWRPFEEARAFVHSLGLKNKDAWMIWAKSSARQENIPVYPNEAYKNKGWVSWGDWLGTGRIANQNIKFRPFEEARVFVHTLGLKNQAEWYAWAKTSAKPDDIPASPQGTYKNTGWLGLGDWLGTGYIAPTRRNYLPFEEARAFVNTLKIKNVDEWRVWAKDNALQNSIPNDPYQVYSKDWVSWGDWLGTGNKKGGYRSFEDARAYAHTLGLNKSSEWFAWAKTATRPDDIPLNPRTVYKEYWVSMGDWLGTGSIWSALRVYRPFGEARTYAQSLKLKSIAEWNKWAKSGNKPNDIPAYPNHVYRDKGWVTWGNWLGTDNLAPSKHIYRPFEEARLYAQGLSLKNSFEWFAWARTNKRPKDIPASPSETYKSKGWISWSDWLRTKNKKGGWRSYDDTREFVRKLNLAGQSEWANWVKTSAKPDDIPSDPRSAYGKDKWNGWGDWLGTFNRWNKYAVLSFLYSIKPVLGSLQSSELYAIMRQNGMITATKNSKNTNATLIKSIRELCSSPNPEADFEKLISEVERENQLLDEGIDEEQITEIEIIETLVTDELPALRSLQALKAVDELVQAGITSDEETIEFLIANRVSGLWQDVLNNGGAIDLEALRNEKGGMYFETIRSRFLSQYDEAQNLAIPHGYDFRVEGKLAEPNLMQRLAAYRILTEKRLGNWSGVGAGKTLSAILASRVVDARFNHRCCFQ